MNYHDPFILALIAVSFMARFAAVDGEYVLLQDSAENFTRVGRRRTILDKCFSMTPPRAIPC